MSITTPSHHFLIILQLDPDCCPWEFRTAPTTLYAVARESVDTASVTHHHHAQGRLLSLESPPRPAVHPE